MFERNKHWLIPAIGIAVILCFALAGCGFTEPVVDPVTKVIVEPSPLDQGVKEAAKTIIEGAPADPSNWVGWLYAVATGVVAGGALAVRKWLAKRRAKSPVGSKVNLYKPSL